MSTLLGQSLLYMGATFALGMLFGWLIKDYLVGNTLTALQTEVRFWKKRLEAPRMGINQSHGQLPTRRRKDKTAEKVSSSM